MHKDYELGYELGYADGYEAGWKAAKQSFAKAVSSIHLTDNVNSPVKTHPYDTCSVCGITKGNEPLGHSCKHPLCPIKIEWK